MTTNTRTKVMYFHLSYREKRKHEKVVTSNFFYHFRVSLVRKFDKSTTTLFSSDNQGHWIPDLRFESHRYVTRKRSR